MALSVKYAGSRKRGKNCFRAAREGGLHQFIPVAESRRLRCGKLQWFVIGGWSANSQGHPTKKVARDAYIVAQNRNAGARAWYTFHDHVLKFLRKILFDRLVVLSTSLSASTPDRHGEICPPRVIGCEKFLHSSLRVRTVVQEWRPRCACRGATPDKGNRATRRIVCVVGFALAGVIATLRLAACRVFLQ